MTENAVPGPGQQPEWDSPASTIPPAPLAESAQPALAAQLPSAPEPTLPIMAPPAVPDTYASPDDATLAAYPTLAMPGQAPRTPEASSPVIRPSRTLVLAALAVVLLVATGVMTTLYINKNSALGHANSTISNRESVISAKTTEVDTAHTDLQKARDDLTKIQTDLTGSQNQATELARQKQVISKCLNLMSQILVDAANNDQTAFNKIQKQAETTCKEASKYVD
jgi:flagellar basal body-associated protein FliL